MAQLQNNNDKRSFAEIFNSSEAINNRENLRKEINSRPKQNFGGAFEKSKEERAQTKAMKSIWSEMVRAQGYTVKNFSRMSTRIKN